MEAPPLSSPSSSSSSNGKIFKAAVVAAAVTLLIVGIFFSLYRIHAGRKRRKKIATSFRREDIATDHEEFRISGTKVKGLIVNENGRDVLYIKNSEEENKLRAAFTKLVMNPSYEGEEEKRVDVIVESFRKCKPPGSLHPEQDNVDERVAEPVLPKPENPGTVSPIEASAVPPPPPSSIRKVPAPAPAPAPPPPPPPPTPPPPPPPPPPRAPAPRPPPPMTMKKNSTTPPPPPKAGGLVSSMRPPPTPRGKFNSKTNAAGAQTEESFKGSSAGQAKLKPLHWDKVMANNVDHSVVWNEINDGSLRFDDGLIEMLFGYPTGGQKTPQRNGASSSASSANSTPSAQVFILDPRKSQNTAIVLKSLAVSRREIIDSLLEGHGLATDVLEKLTRISPTQEEVIKLLQFNGNPTKLADAESFLYHILKAVPSAFTRISSMLFRSNYDADILHLKESLQTLELGCKELRARGLFLKLLEAILKAGNKMNAGTSRGNAQGFNLTALRKLSDVKSTDGKTTLLHFVVEQVVRAEGRRCALTRNHSLDRKNNGGGGTKSGLSSDNLTAEEKDRQYLLPGLPVVKGLSLEFCNVKKAATIEYDSFINTSSSLAARVADIRPLLVRCGSGEGAGFVREMKDFLEDCEEELKVVAEEQIRLMELVRRTTEYYQAGASRQKGEHPLQLFVIVKDFLDMVDRVCADISRKLQEKKLGASSSSGPSSPLSPARKFSDFSLPPMSHRSDRTKPSSKSDDDDDF